MEVNSTPEDDAAQPAAEVAPDPRRQRKIITYALTADAVRPGARIILNLHDTPISHAEKEEFLRKLGTGEIWKKQFEEMLSTIPEEDLERRKMYADQFKLLQRESGVRDDVFENGNDLGDPSLKGPWKRY